MALYKGANKAKKLYYGTLEIAGVYLGDRLLWHNAPVSLELIDRTITSCVIPDSVTTIGPSMFANCVNLKSVTIPSSVTGIGSNAFRGCSSLTSLEIPDSVTIIEAYAFADCTSLQSVIFPRSVTILEDGLFDNSPNLTDLYCGFAEGAVSGAPWGAPETCTIHYNSTGSAA